MKKQNRPKYLNLKMSACEMKLEAVMLCFVSFKYAQHSYICT